MTEEEKMSNQEEILDDVYSYPRVPYFLIDDEIEESKKQQYFKELSQIAKLYNNYEKGIKFIPEGTNSDYVPSRLRFKKASMIMNKEARFLFSNAPSFNVNIDDVSGKYTDENTIMQKFLDKVLEKTNFNSKLIKGVKDCFIGKRVAIVLNFNEDNGITITFLNSMEFVYEIDRENDVEISKFVTFYEQVGTDSLINQRWFKKVYVKEYDGVYITEEIYSGDGKLIEVITPRTKILFNYIPAFVILNDGLTGDTLGVSEIGNIIDYEKDFSKLSNCDMDAQRKSMNPIRYTIDASQGSTKNLPTSPGSYWDLQSDSDKSTELGAKVGTLEAQMNYSIPLKTTLERIENEMYSELDVPNITSEQLAGVITSGKTIQALYWGLTVRCDEKMLTWGPQLRSLAYAIIEGGVLYPNCIKKYTLEDELPNIPFDIIVENNYPIPEDYIEEKNIDISEVESNIMSRKAYMKKWRNLSDDEADNELQQIQREKNMLENSVLPWDEEQTVVVDEQTEDDVNE